MADQALKSEKDDREFLSLIRERIVLSELCADLAVEADAFFFWGA